MTQWNRNTFIRALKLYCFPLLLPYCYLLETLIYDSCPQSDYMITAIGVKAGWAFKLLSERFLPDYRPRKQNMHVER